ncbi:hypothetical protein B0A54_04728 [Friedmanniomyces endolithicus]|uniref:Uncharacterized protein n=1 Tax=Friedmanniomyces endolithicus TaxID=329885 RepID=A0A4U0V7P8_9PEZI|nr:hypothetical protein B0A54_04728 [Friedmanniomyces endolithicus]
MRTTFFTLAAIAGTVFANDNPANFLRDTAASSTAGNGAIGQISDGQIQAPATTAAAAPSIPAGTATMASYGSLTGMATSAVSAPAGSSAGAAYGSSSAHASVSPAGLSTAAAASGSGSGSAAPATSASGTSTAAPAKSTNGAAGVEIATGMTLVGLALAFFA